MNSYGDEAITQQLLMRLRNARGGNIHGGGGYGSGSTKERAKLNPYIQYVKKYRTSVFTGNYKQYIQAYKNRNQPKNEQLLLKYKPIRKKRVPCAEPKISFTDSKGKIRGVCPTTSRGKRIIKSQSDDYILSHKGRYVLKSGKAGKQAIKNSMVHDID